MYQAIEAISRAGVIQPLEPVEFGEDEHLVILRLSKTYIAQTSTTSQEQPADWQHLAGVLKDSPHLNGDPLAIQKKMRHEWD